MMPLILTGLFLVYKRGAVAYSHGTKLFNNNGSDFQLDFMSGIVTSEGVNLKEKTRTTAFKQSSLPYQELRCAVFSV